MTVTSTSGSISHSSLPDLQLKLTEEPYGHDKADTRNQHFVTHVRGRIARGKPPFWQMALVHWIAAVDLVELLRVLSNDEFGKKILLLDTAKVFSTARICAEETQAMDADGVLVRSEIEMSEGSRSFLTRGFNSIKCRQERSPPPALRCYWSLIEPSTLRPWLHTDTENGDSEFPFVWECSLGDLFFQK